MSGHSGSPKPFYLPCRPFIHVIKKPHIPTPLLIPSVPWHFPRPASTQIKILKVASRRLQCRNLLQWLHSCRRDPAAAGVRASKKSFPRCTLRDATRATVVCGAHRVLCQRVAGSDTSRFYDCWRMLSPAMCLAKYWLYVSWSNAFFISGVTEKNIFLDVMCFTGRVYFRFSFMPSVFVGVFWLLFIPLFTLFCHICGLYFNVWWLNVCTNPRSEYLCPTSANRAPTEHFIFNELCALKDDQGPCKAIKDRFFFNIDNGRCELFEYGGCGGNANNFVTLEECEESCVVSGKSDSSRLCQVLDLKGSSPHAMKLFDNVSDTKKLHFY